MTHVYISFVKDEVRVYILFVKDFLYRRWSLLEYLRFQQAKLNGVIHTGKSYHKYYIVVYYLRLLLIYTYKISSMSAHIFTLHLLFIYS